MITGQQRKQVFSYSYYYCEKEGVLTEQIFLTNDREQFEKYGVLNHFYKPLYPNETELQKYGLKPQGRTWEKCNIFRERSCG